MGKRVIDDAAGVWEKLTQAMWELHFPIAVHLFQNKKKRYYLKFKDSGHAVILPVIICYTLVQKEVFLYPIFKAYLKHFYPVFWDLPAVFCSAYSTWQEMGKANYHSC